MLKVCIIMPPTWWLDESVFYPTTLAVLSAIVRSAGHEVIILDLNAHMPMPDEQGDADLDAIVMDAIETHASDADVFGFTTFYSCYPHIFRWAEALKQRYGRPIVLGGPHATIAGRETLEIAPAIDFVVKHEAEETFPELLDAIEHQRDSSEIKGVVSRKNGVVVEAPDRPLIDDLDASPFPDFHLIDVEPYERLSEKLSIPIDIGRGCPYSCTFCPAGSMWNHSCRMKSPERILAEMDAVNKLYGTTRFMLASDNLTTKSDFMYAFCDAMRERDYKWNCYSRFDTLDKDLLGLMMDAGCVDIFFGIESGSKRMQRRIKKNLNLNEARDIFQACLDKGLDVSTSYVVGFPDETRGDVELTLRTFMSDSALTKGNCHLNVLKPFPAAEVSEGVRGQEDLVSRLNYDRGLHRLKGATRKASEDLILSNSDVFLPFSQLKMEHCDCDEIYGIVQLFSLLGFAYPRTTQYVLDECNLNYYDVYADYSEGKGLTALDNLTSETAGEYLATIIEQHGQIQGFDARYAQNLLKYETIAYTLRTAERRDGNVVDKRKQSQRRVHMNPGVVRASFDIDLSEMIRSGYHPSIYHDSPVEYLLIFDRDRDYLAFCNVDEDVTAAMELAKGEPTCEQFLTKLRKRCDGDDDFVESLTADMLDAGFLEYHYN